MYGYTIPKEALEVPIELILQIFNSEIHQLSALLCVFFSNTLDIRECCTTSFSFFLEFICSVDSFSDEEFRNLQLFLVDFVILTQFCNCFHTNCQVLNPVIKRHFVKSQPNTVDTCLPRRIRLSRWIFCL